MRTSRRRRPFRRLRRALRRSIPRLNRLQLLAIAGMLVATVGLGLAVTVLTRDRDHTGASPSATSPPTGVALLPSLASVPSAAPGVSSIPVTARLIVPAGGIDIAVVEGDGVHVPLHLAMHYPGSSEPGGGRNSLFYAHGQPGMFLGLYRVHQGDEIRAVRADGTILQYHVSQIIRVAWNDLAIAQPNPGEQITLLTCTSYNPFDPRYIVIGTQG